MFFDVPAARPEARDEPEGRGVVALSEPLARGDALAIVRSYFRAFDGVDPHPFAPLLTPDARRLGEGAAADLGARLQKRVHAIDYSHLACESLPLYDEIRITPLTLAPAFAKADVRVADEMRAGDLLVDVPVREERVDRMRAFGPHVILVLRRERAETTLASWVIAAEREDGFTWP